MTDTAELIARTTRLEPIAWRAVKALRYSLGWTALADALSEYIAAAASLTEQVEGLTRDVNRYAYERDKAREERDKAERRSEAFWKPQVETAEAEVARLRAENEKLRKALKWYADPSNYMARFDPYDDRRRYPPKTILDDGRRARAALSNTSEGGKDE